MAGRGAPPDRAAPVSGPAPRSAAPRSSPRCAPALPATCCAGVRRDARPAGRTPRAARHAAGRTHGARQAAGGGAGPGECPALPRLAAGMGAGGPGRQRSRIATSDERDAHETLAAFRLRPEPSVLVTVAMAYEGLDAPAVAVCAALTHIRSRAWLEQMIARATRVDPAAGPYRRSAPWCSTRTTCCSAASASGSSASRARSPATARRAGRVSCRSGGWPWSRRPSCRLPPMRPPSAGSALPRAGFRRRPAGAAPDPAGGPARPALPARARVAAQMGLLVAAQVVEDEGMLRIPRGAGGHHAYRRRSSG